LPQRHTKTVDVGMGKTRSVNAADTTRGQYIALKSAIKSAY
jgi:hypothetical protein